MRIVARNRALGQLLVKFEHGAGSGVHGKPNVCCEEFMSTSPSVSPTSLTSSASTGHPGLPNLTALIESKTTPERVKEVATGQRVAREFKAYGYLSAQANVSGDPRAYLKAYLTYYDSLSPEEQQSSRYKGTREGALKGLADSASLGNTQPSAQVPDLPILAAPQTQQAWSPFPSADLLRGLKSLLGIIEQTRHPDPVARKPISNFDFKA